MSNVPVQNAPIAADHSDLFETLVAQLTDFAVFLIDLGGIIASWNPGVERLLGYSEAEWLGQPLDVIFTPEDRGHGTPDREIEVAEGSGKAPDTRWLMRKDGQRIFVEGTLVALRGRSGELLGYSKVIRDITERKVREQQLQNALDYAEGIVNTVGEPLLLLNREGRVQYANAAFCEHFKMGKDEAENLLLSQFLDGCWDEPQVRSLFERLEADPAAVPTIDFEADVPQIGRRSMVLKARRLWRDSKYTELTLLAIDDVTEKLAAERAVAESEKQIRMLMDATPAIISYIDKNLRYRMANDAYQRWFGIAPADLLGRSIFEVFDSPLFSTIQPYIDRALHGETVSFQADYSHANGPKRILEVTYTPELDRAGEVQGFMVLGSDVTGRAEAARALKENEAQLQRYVTLQSALVTLGDRLRDLKDLESLTSTAMKLVTDVLDIDRAGYGEVDSSQQYITIRNDWHSDRVGSLGGTYRFSDFGKDLGTRLASGETVVVSDVSADPLTAGESARWIGLDIRALINVPLLGNGRMIAVLFVQSSTPRIWSEIELNFLRKVADRTWVAAERARAIQELQESEEFNRSVLASTPDCVKVLDLDGRLLTMNQGGCHQMEIDDVSKYTNSPWTDLWTESKDVAESAVREARAGGTVRFEAFCPTVKNTPKWWEVVVAPILDNAGKPLRILSLSRDISDRKNAEKERERLTGELTRSNEELSHFAHIVAHDLQSPLRAVTSFAQLLGRRAKDKLSESEQRLLAQIIESAGRMHTFVHAILRFAQVGQGMIALDRVRMDDAANAVLETLQEDIHESGAIIRCEPLPVVLGDGVQLTHVLQNLISNALKYHRPGVPPEIKVGAVRERDRYVFSVADNGQGIAPEHLHQVFEPLKRLHGSEVPGSGLGLAICQRIVTRHNGRMWVDSERGRGSTFYFTLQSA